MNEFWLIIGIFVVTIVVLAAYHLMSELFKRWLENDWCRHQWTTWQDNGTYEQFRHCTKCNKKERRSV